MKQRKQHTFAWLKLHPHYMGRQYRKLLEEAAKREYARRTGGVTE